MSLTKPLKSGSVVQSVERRRDAFEERFGDKLCIDLLKYLSFEEKIRYECVSKRFRRCVYQRQHQLVINQTKGTTSPMSEWFSVDINEKHSLDHKVFDSVLKKCKSIQSVLIFGLKYHYEVIIVLIVLNCRQLSTFGCDFSELKVKTINGFFSKFGPTLKTLYLLNTSVKINRFITDFCPNLQRLVSYEGIDELFSDGRLLVQTLKSYNLFVPSAQDLDKIEVFVEKHKNILTQLMVYSGVKNKTDFKTLMNLLSKLQSLTTFRLFFDGLDDCLNFDKILIQGLQTMANNCLHLHSFELIVFKPIKDLNHILSNISFTQLRRLSIRFSKEETFNLKRGFTCRSLRHFKSLFELVLDFKSLPKHSLTDEFFKDIDQYLPNLQVLEVMGATITDITIICLSKLNNVKICRFFASNESVVTPKAIVLVNNRLLWPRVLTLQLKVYKKSIEHKHQGYKCCGCAKSCDPKDMVWVYK